MASWLDTVVRTLDAANARSATAYISPRRILRATRRLYGGRIDRRRATDEILITIGRPNYAERQFIKVLKKAGEPFPVKKVQLKFPPKKKAH
jgi:hypothetical protein